MIRKSPITLLTFLGITLAIIISRVFLLGPGYGMYPDAWRAFLASEHLVATGTYVPSRFPGYPLPEYFGALLLRTGFASPFAFELPVAILSGVACGIFLLLLLPLGYITAVSLSLALAFTPIFFVSSISSMDHIYGATFFITATLLAFRGRVLWSSIFLGLATASRPTYAIAYIPLALTLIDFRFDRKSITGSLRKLIAFAAVSGGTALLFYVPLFYEYGTSFLTFYDERVGSWATLRRLTIEIFGKIGFIGVVVASAGCIFTFSKAKLKTPYKRNLLLFAFTTTAIYVTLFLRLPAQAAYLIPALLAFYMWLAICMSPRWTLVLPGLLLASCFFHLKTGIGYLFVERGPIPVSRLVQHSYTCVANEVAIKARDFDADTYIMAGFLTPPLKVLLPAPISHKLIHNVQSVTPSGYNTEEDPGMERITLPLTSEFWTIDSVDSYVRSLNPDQVPVSGMINTMTACAH